MDAARRWFLTRLPFAMLALPLASEAQQSQKVYRIGMLERTSPAINAANLDGFKRGLCEFGTSSSCPCMPSDRAAFSISRAPW